MPTSASTDRPHASRQFSLRTMLGFVVACGAYLASLSWIPACHDHMWERDLPHWTVQAAIPAVFAWAVLRYSYRKWRLPGAVMVLEAALITLLIPLILLAAALLVADSGDLRHAAVGFAVCVCCSCGVGVLVSFPIALLTMVYLAASAKASNGLAATRLSRRP